MAYRRISFVAHLENMVGFIVGVKGQKNHRTAPTHSRKISFVKKDWLKFHQ